MPVFKSPYTGRMHHVNEYDEDYMLDNKVTEEKKSQDEFNNDVLTQTNWNMNRWSTKKDEYRDIPMDKEQIDYHVQKYSKFRKPRSMCNY
jgi:hypothetical protein